MISELEVLTIKNLYHRDRLSINAIVKQTGRHHHTVKRVLFAKSCEGKPGKRLRTSKYQALLSEQAEFIKKRMDEHPRLAAPRLSQMLQDIGVKIPPHQLRSYLRQHFPRRDKKAYMRVVTLPGEQAQVDWTFCGKVKLGQCERRLSLFVMVLSYSRAMYARFFVNERAPSVGAGHVRAFKYFGGVPRQLVYDNMRTAVVERNGSAIRFHGGILELAGKYNFMPRACTPYSAWEKGRVERSIRYIKDNFLTGRKFITLDQANAEIEAWLDTVANQRPWIEDRQQSVHHVWQSKELPTLAPFIDDGFEVFEKTMVMSGKTPYVKFDLNSYSIPPKYVQHELSVMSNEDRVRVFYLSTEIANHQRTYSRGEYVEDKSHIEALIIGRHSSRFRARKDYVYELLPASERFFRKLSERGYQLNLAFRKLYELTQSYSLQQINAAMQELCDKDYAGMDVLAHHLVRRLKGEPEKRVSLNLSLYPELSHIRIRSHDLASYDSLASVINTTTPKEDIIHG